MMCESQRRLAESLVADLVTSKQAPLIKASVIKILKEQLGVVGIVPTEEEIDEAFNNEMLDVAWRLVANGFKLTKDGLPIPANWDISQEEEFFDEKWLEKVNGSLPRTRNGGMEIKGVRLKQTKVIHTDELVKVIKLDNIGKGYAILANDTDPRKGLSGITFHTGNPLDGVNGISIESLLAICKDRLETFNAQGFACKENDIAIECCTAAIESLQIRQKRRKEENKAGTQEK